MQMIEGTLTIKRFADKAVGGLFASNVPKTQQADEHMSSMKDLEEPVQALGVSERRRQIELEDSIRVGLKAGMGSRQNAPAEWIGQYFVHLWLILNM